MEEEDTEATLAAEEVTGPTEDGPTTGTMGGDDEQTAETEVRAAPHRSALALSLDAR